MAKYDVPYKVKGGYGGTLHMIVEAPDGTTAKKIVSSMISANGGEVIGTPRSVK